MISLQDMNILFGTVSVILLIFSETLANRHRQIELRLSKDRLRKISLFSSMAFLVTLIIIIMDTFLLVG